MFGLCKAGKVAFDLHHMKLLVLDNRERFFFLHYIKSQTFSRTRHFIQVEAVCLNRACGPVLASL